MTRNLLSMLLFPLVSLSQNVGIGIAPTKAKLEISGSVGNNVAIFGGDGAGVSLQQNWPSIGFNQYYNGGSYNMVTNFGFVEYVDMNIGSFCFDMTTPTTGPNQPSSQIRRMSITQNGNVHINAAWGNASLTSGNPANQIPAAQFRGTQYHSIFYEIGGTRNTTINAGKAGGVVLLNDKVGGNLYIGGGSTKVGINSVNPTDILEVKQHNGRGLALINSGFNFWQLFVAKNLEEFAGDMYVFFGNNNLGNFYQGDGKYYYYSDRRVKTNIQDLNPALPGILALQPKQYEIKYDNPGHTASIGLIAQEARMVFPEITSHIEGEDLGYGGMKDLYTMDYNALGPLAIKAIQEQQQKVEKLKAQVAALQQRIVQAEKLLGKTTASNPTN